MTLAMKHPALLLLALVPCVALAAWAGHRALAAHDRFGAAQRHRESVMKCVALIDELRNTTPSASPKPPPNVSGQVASSALSAGPDDTTIGDRLGMLALSLLNLAAVLSVAVGFVNLLPIPILDGGYLVMCAIEALRGGKPLPPMAQEWAFRAGVAVLASLFLFATWNDITRLLAGGAG